MTIEQRKEDSKFLKHGDLTLISKESGVSVDNVWKWINGKLMKSSCEKYFEVLVEKRKEELENFKQSI